MAEIKSPFKEHFCPDGHSPFIESWSNPEDYFKYLEIQKQLKIKRENYAKQYRRHKKSN